MKKDIHPANYREVVFKDMSNDETFITRSTVATRETIEIDGVTYPLVKLEITSSSHPFFTGKQKLVDTAGRVDKFMSRYSVRNKKSFRGVWPCPLRKGAATQRTPLRRPLSFFIKIVNCGCLLNFFCNFER